MNYLLRGKIEQVCFCFMLSVAVCFLCGLQVQAEEGETITYEVQQGDCLWQIAREELGNPQLYVRIYEDNKERIGEDMDLILPGTNLVLHKQNANKGQEDIIETLLGAYFKAKENGDAEAFSQLYHKKPEQLELLRLQCMGKYIERIENVEFYEVKDSRLTGSVVAVTYDCLFQDTNVFLPGYICLYVKWDAQEKELYLDGEMDLNLVYHMDLTGEERRLLEEIEYDSAKAREMMKEVTEEYDALLLANPGLQEKLDEISTKVSMDMDKEAIMHEEELY